MVKYPLMSFELHFGRPRAWADIVSVFVDRLTARAAHIRALVLDVAFIGSYLLEDGLFMAVDAFAAAGAAFRARLRNSSSRRSQ